MRWGRQPALALGIALVSACLEAPPVPTDQQAAVDASPADGALADAPPGAEACFEAFGHLKDYQLCSSDGVQCEFFVNIDGDATCMQLCNAVGHECVQSYDSSNALPVCTREEAEECVGLHSTLICVCEL